MRLIKKKLLEKLAKCIQSTIGSRETMRWKLVLTLWVEYREEWNCEWHLSHGNEGKPGVANLWIKSTGNYIFKDSGNSKNGKFCHIQRIITHAMYFCITIVIEKEVDNMVLLERWFIMKTLYIYLSTLKKS